MDITDLNHDAGSVASFKAVTLREMLKVWIFRAGNYCLWLLFFCAFARVIIWAWERTLGQCIL